MSVAAGDLFRVAAVGQVFMQRVMLTHAYAVLSVDPGQGELAITTKLIDGLRAGGGGDAWETAYMACLPPQYTLSYWHAQKVAPVRYRYHKVTRDIPGDHGANTEATNQTGTITLQTLLSGRDQIAVKHIGPIPQDITVQADGLLTTAYKTLLNTLANGLLAQITDETINLVMVPVIPHSATPGSYTLAFSAITGETINVMRRRTVGRGI